MNRRDFLSDVAGLSALTAAGVQARGQTPPPHAGSIADVPGVSVGHFTDTRRPTGCTVLLFDPAAAAGVDYGGSAPGESQGVLLQPTSPIERIHAIFLTGGGVLSLPASAGVLRYFEEHHAGFDWGTPGVRIPIVVSGVIDDLAVGDPRIRPDAEAAYRACTIRSEASAEGNVGVGAGATIGKMHVTRGFNGMKGGLGTASVTFGDVIIGALAVVNAAGDVLDWRSGQILAGAHRADGAFVDSVKAMEPIVLRTGTAQGAALHDPALRSTTLAVVATNVDLAKTALTRIALMSNCGAARAIRPYHTTGDGDQMFAVSTARVQRPDLPLTVIGALAADLVADAIVRAVRAAKSIPDWPGLNG